MFAGSLTSGWKKKKNIKARRRGSVGKMMGSVPALIMLGTIACVGFSSPTSACSYNVLEKLGGQQWSMGPSSQEPLYPSGS
jgi:hypothetical protein